MTGSLVPPSASIAGRYTVERELGHGATATVYLARDQVHGRPVALKVLHPDLTASVGAERFLREIRLTAQLHHPHIVPVLDSGEHDGLLFCVLPYMDGGTLRDRLDREKQLPIEEAVAIARTVGEALAYAHERGLIHRDVKPENILFSVGQPCLADFGIAKALEHVPGDSTSTGIVRGTPAYMSPEQAGGERNYDGRSDVYSLACVLYEMIAGMPAFIGPTTQSLLAQRMIHQPRELSVYRARVSAELEAVVEKALQPAPADRYAGAKEFVEALEAAPIEGGRTPTQQMRVSGVWRAQKRWRAVAVGAIGVLGIVFLSGLGFWWRARENPLSSGVATDTTRIVLLPFEGTSDAASGTQNELVYEAFLRWKGITPVEPFQVSDALSRLPSAAASDASARHLARDLGAGRFVRGLVMTVGDQLRVRATLYDVKSDAVLYQTVLSLPGDFRGADSVYAALADSLLLRGSGESGRVTPSGQSHSLPAVQAFASGMRAVDDWDLQRADSLFQAAIGFDAEYARAYLWSAQVRAWRSLPAQTWIGLAQRARESSSRLSEREQRVARALESLASGKFAAACDAYAALRDANPLDFTAWYGLGQCHDLDTVIVRDPRGAFGWRYRSSYHQAVLAYSRAFEILPSAHRSFQRGAYEPLRQLLFTRVNKLRPALTATPDSQKFYGRADWRGDSLIIVPIPQALIRAGDPRATPSGIAAAARHEREVFHRIASVWSSALPRSAGAKEALAVGLEMLGDARAVDTMHIARSLTDDVVQRWRLAATEAVLRVKFGIPDRLDELRLAQALADSLLGTAAAGSASSPSLVAALSALTGRCALAEAGARRATPDDPQLAPAPHDVIADAEVLATSLAIGCENDTRREFRRSLARMESPKTPRLTEYLVLQRALHLATPFDSTMLVWFSGVTNDYILEAQRAVVLGTAGVARTRLSAVGTARQSTGFDVVAPEAVLTEARLWLALGDTATAAGWLDKVLGRIRFSTPGALHEGIAAGSLVSDMALRARIANEAHDPDTSRRWANAVLALWRGADPALRPVLDEMRRYANGH